MWLNPFWPSLDFWAIWLKNTRVAEEAIAEAQRQWALACIKAIQRAMQGRQ